MAVMAQTTGTFTTPGRVMDFVSAVASSFSRSTVWNKTQRSERFYDVNAWRSEREQGVGAGDAAARFSASGQIW
jgi:hypothetical protein